MVEIVVSVPDPHSWDSVFLAGDSPELGRWLSIGARCQRFSDGTHRLMVPVHREGERVRFLVTRGHWRDAEVGEWGREARPREIELHRDTRIEHRVEGWGRQSIHYHVDFPSEFLPHPHTLTVYLPPGYELEPERRYPVFYMHDGQNLFDAHTSFIGVPWGCDEIAERVIRQGEVEPLIIVGIANTPDRLLEYGPRRGTGSEDSARAYGRFLAEGVVPFINETYRTRFDLGSTGVGGSSMGGLISLHLCEWYPNLFGRCAALSPSLWWDREAFAQSIHASARWTKTCRVWLDVGANEGGSDAGRQGMLRRSRALAEQLRELGTDLRFHEDPHGSHHESSWGGRFSEVLKFLYPARPSPPAARETPRADQDDVEDPNANADIGQN